MLVGISWSYKISFTFITKISLLKIVCFAGIHALRFTSCIKNLILKYHTGAAGDQIRVLQFAPSWNGNENSHNSLSSGFAVSRLGFHASFATCVSHQWKRVICVLVSIRVFSSARKIYHQNLKLRNTSHLNLFLPAVSDSGEEPSPLLTWLPILFVKGWVRAGLAWTFVKGMGEER